MLAATKLQIPRPREPVARDRLVARLLANLGTKLSAVSAPAGAGKTTLLAAWASEPEEHRRFGWLSLDASDNDPVRFFEGAIAALRMALPGLGEDALGALAGPTRLTDVMLPSLINDLASQDAVVLVLDDYHLIRNEEIHEAVDYLLEHLPDTLHLAIATRGEPPLALSRLRARRELVEIDAADLRFTDEEAVSLLNGNLELGLKHDDIVQLQHRTEGWAAGLRRWRGSCGRAGSSRRAKSRSG